MFQGLADEDRTLEDAATEPRGLTVLRRLDETDSTYAIALSQATACMIKWFETIVRRHEFHRYVV